MISFDEATELVRSVATPLGTETVPITEAAGRVLAKAVTAKIDSPRADVSAMDGYAVRVADLDEFPARLQLIGSSYAGAGWNGSIAPGTCVRIFTGAPVPEGADRVVVQEDVRSDGDAAIIHEHPGTDRYIRKRGSDFTEGEELLSAGRLLGPRALVAAASADVAELEVHRRPSLHILCTGDELAEPGSTRESVHAVPESVSLGVVALSEQWGGECIGRTIVGDDLQRLHDVALSAVEEVDLFVVTGGASVGEKDFAKAMFEPLGMELVFSKVSIKPGKPVWLGRVRDKLILGLPGNPTSALVTARLFLAPLLAGLTGRRTDEGLSWRTARLATPLGPGATRETFHRARSCHGAAEILSFQDSSAQKVLADADLLVRLAANSLALQAGTGVEVLDF